MKNNSYNYSVYGDCQFILENLHLKKSYWLRSSQLAVIIVATTRIIFEIIQIFQVISFTSNTFISYQLILLDFYKWCLDFLGEFLIFSYIYSVLFYIYNKLSGANTLDWYLSIITSYKICWLNCLENSQRVSFLVQN